MKLRKPGTRASVVRGAGKQKVEGDVADVALDSVESVDAVEQADRFEVGSQGPAHPEEEERSPDEDQQLFADAFDDPALAKAVTLPVMIGSESLPSNVEASLKGIMALVDTEEEGG